MNILVLMLVKDLRRAWRNPVPWLIHIGVPVLITALIGLAFGGSDKTSALGRIKVAVVDEDDSALTGFLRGTLNQRELSDRFEPVFATRNEALVQILENRLSAAIIIPSGFTRDFLSGERSVVLELIKNPAQSFHPAIVEELLGVLTTGLDILARLVRPDYESWQQVFDRPEGPDFSSMASLIQRTGQRLESARPYLYPPLVGLEKVERSEAARTEGKTWNAFAFILPGMAALFLLFQADNAVRDLYRERRFRTLERFQTVREGLLPLVTAKVVFALVMLLLTGMIFFGGGALVFRIHWKQPLAVGILLLTYSFFAAGFMAFMAGWAGKEKRADVLNNIVAMAMGLAGGCMFPREQLPGFLRDHITPWLPTNWLVEAVRATQFGEGDASWAHLALRLSLIGGVLLVSATWLFQRRLRLGERE
ncbi:MAG TPA: ABC transporter permease [Verrucomicrobiota bacterium]|nr:ABC transporter permease [Verrucomicrobiota bacterium]